MRPERFHSLRGLVIAAVGALTLAGCTPWTTLGIEMREQSRFHQQWKRYRQLDDFKALAIAGDVEGVYVSGFSYRMTSINDAVHAALVQCEQRRIDRRIAAPCRTLAIGNEQVKQHSSPRHRRPGATGRRCTPERLSGRSAAPAHAGSSMRLGPSTMLSILSPLATSTT